VTSSPPAVLSIADRVRAVRARIEAACARVGRDPSSVTLVAVSKTFGVDAIVEALAAGVADLGENRAQEFVPKARAVAQADLPAGVPTPRWHFIGHLQRNKVRDVVPLIEALHSLDSERLVEAVSAERIVARGAHPLPCYIEVNVAAEEQKLGVGPAEVGPLLAAARRAPGIEVVGLMTVAPLVADPDQARPAFRALRELAATHGLPGLSMGMTNDFEVAVEEGATLVRVGRAIFGDRPA
jgi:pyridoxal phosphate enzyme (YggS family)